MGLSLPLLMVDYVSIGVGVSVIILGLVVMAFLSRKSSSPKATASTSTPNKNTTKAETSVFLNKQRQSVPLSEIIELSHDTRLYRFSLPTQNSTAPTVWVLSLASGTVVRIPSMRRRRSNAVTHPPAVMTISVILTWLSRSTRVE